MTCASSPAHELWEADRRRAGSGGRVIGEQQFAPKRPERAAGRPFELAFAILRAVGQTVWLDDEALIDPVTAVSGSGPAYVFYFIEAMQQAAQQMGLTAEQGTTLAIATFAGAAELAAQSTEPVSTLRERVTSKGGTTYAALTSMEADHVREAIGRAMFAAAARGKELGEEFGKD